MWSPRQLPLASDGTCQFTRMPCVKAKRDCEAMNDVDGQIAMTCQYRLWEEVRKIVAEEFPNPTGLSFWGGQGREVPLEDGPGASRFDAVASHFPTRQTIACELVAYNITGSHSNGSANLNEADAALKLGLGQIMRKGRYCHNAGIPFYWLMQERMFEYLHHKVPFAEVAGGTLKFFVFAYSSDGLRLERRRVVSTTCEEIVRCQLPTVPFGHDQTSRRALVARALNLGLSPFAPDAWMLPHQPEAPKALKPIDQVDPLEQAIAKELAEQTRDLEKDIFEMMMRGDP